MRFRIFIYFVFALILSSGCSKPDNTVSYYEEIKAADKMVFATMSITKTARLEDSEWYKVGKRMAVYSYDTYLQAYIDMSLLMPEDLVFDEKTRTVRVTLPPVVTEVAGRDMEMRKVYENVGVFRSEIDAKERAAIKEQANKSLKKELEQNGTFKRQLTEAAERKARQYFESLFKANGYTAIVGFRSPDTDYNSLKIATP